MKPKHDVVDDEDVLEKLLKSTGCLELHYEVQKCIAENKDWRVCQTQVLDFRKCMEAHKEKLKSKIAAQCCHATLGCYRRGLTVSPEKIKLWELKNEAKVILRTNSGEAGLKSLAYKASDAGVVAVIVRDAGRTQIPTGTATVLGIGPDSMEKINKITSQLKLM